MIDIRIIAPRAAGERMARAVCGRAYETRGPRDEVRVYVARASAADLRALADAMGPTPRPSTSGELAREREAAAEAAAIRAAHGDPSA